MFTNNIRLIQGDILTQRFIGHNCLADFEHAATKLAKVGYSIAGESLTVGIHDKGYCMNGYIDLALPGAEKPDWIRYVFTDVDTGIVSPFDIISKCLSHE